MFTKVCFHAKAPIAEIIRNVLLDNRLHPTEIDYSSNISLAGVLQGYFIEVPTGEADIAKRVLSENNFGKFIVES